MKTLVVLSFALLGLIPAVSGTTTTIDNAASAAALDRSVTVQAELLAQLKIQATSSDATLSRPL